MVVVEPYESKPRARRGHAWFAYVPLLAFIVVLYGALALLGVNFADTLFTAPLPSGGQWVFKVSDAVLTLALFLLFIEILKSTRTGGDSVVDHALSTIVLIVCIILFLVWSLAATSVFFLITMVSLIDVVAGFSITIRAARRDYSIGNEG